MKHKSFTRAGKFIRNALAFGLALAIVVLMSAEQGPQPTGTRSLLRHHLGRAEHDFESA